MGCSDAPPATAPPSDAAVVPQPSDEAFVWKYKFGQGNAGGGPVEAIAMHSDGTSAVAVSITEMPEGGQNLVRVVRLDANGKELWHADFRHEYVPIPIDLTMDREGKVIVMGRYWIGRVDAEGEHSQWVNAELPELNRLHRLVAAEDGSIVIVGNPRDSLEMRVIKLDANDKLVWSRKLGQKNGNGDFGLRVALGPESEIVAGGTTGGIEKNEVLIQKYDRDGNALWPEPIRYATEDNAWLSGLAVLPGGQIMAVGRSRDAADDWKAWANLYDANGGAVWPRPFLLTATEFQDPVGEESVALEGEQDADVRADSVAVSPSGGAVVVGVRGRDRWLQRFDSSGAPAPDCGQDRCDVPFVYLPEDGRTPSQVKVDPTGHMVLVWESGFADGEVELPNGKLWVGKLTAPLVP